MLHGLRKLRRHVLNWQSDTLLLSEALLLSHRLLDNRWLTKGLLNVFVNTQTRNRLYFGRRALLGLLRQLPIIRDLRRLLQCLDLKRLHDRLLVQKLRGLL